LLFPQRFGQGLRSKGTQVNVYDDGNRIIVEPLADDLIKKGRGMLKTRGTLLRALEEDRKKEAEL
jgi:hypothetical protein